MGFFDFFKRDISDEIKASIGVAQMMISGKEHSYGLVDWKAYAKEGYALNPTVFACINLLASSFARIPLKALNEMGEEIGDSPLQRLLDRPNIDCGAVEFRTDAASWLLLTGNCFTEKLMSGGLPVELYNWQPYDFSVGRAKGSRIPARYIWRKGMEGQKSWDVDLITGESDLLHWRTFNPSPTDNTFGLSPMSAAAASADSYNSAAKLRFNKMKNGLSIDGILSPTQNGELDQKQRTELETKIREKYTGVNGLRVAVSNSPMQFTTMTSTLRDAEWGFGTKLNKQEICEVFRVPTQLIGIENSQTYSNFSEANLSFFKQAVIPLADLYCSEMNRWLGKYFPGQKIGYHRSSIDALEADRAERRAAKIASGCYSINEIRAEFGDAPRDEPEADAIMTNPSQIPLGMDVFAESEKPAEDVAKALMRGGMPRAEAEQKALDWWHDSQDTKRS